MSVSIPEDDRRGQGQTTCAECPNKTFCLNVRWADRLCEITQQQQRDGGALPSAMQADGNVPSPLACRGYYYVDAVPPVDGMDRVKCHCQLPAGHQGLHGPASSLEATAPIQDDPAPWQRPRDPQPFSTAVREDMNRQIEQMRRQPLGGEYDDLPAEAVGPSGALSSGKLPRYDLIPWHVFADRLAQRYSGPPGGAAKYGEYNWQKGITDREYVLDRANHALKHLHRAVERIRSGSQVDARTIPLNYLLDDDDDLAAALWGIIFLMAAQKGSADL